MKTRAMLLAGFLVLAVAWTGERDLLSRAREDAVRSPFENDDRAARAGSKLYARTCAPCHGLQREGHGRVPPLDRAAIRQAPPGRLFWILRNGSLRTGMPSFASLPEPERWQIIAYLRQSASANNARAVHPNR
jgi:mono/diheme cytochrome c family protein